jgi:LmbE family N-acetylglucosaminyl deacetylase
MENRRVLAIMPHPDDIEFLCAGTLLRLREAGLAIHVATMTAGDKGSAKLSRKHIADIRRKEAQCAAETLGAVSYTCLEFTDLEIVFDNPSRCRVASLLRKIDPHIVFTTPPADYMFDHEITSHLVRDACFNAAVKNYETEREDSPMGGVPYLYYSDPIGGHTVLGDPAPVHCIVDISAHIKTKVEALACHESQRAWLQKQHGMDDYVETMKRWSKHRGERIGVDFGEAFCQHRGHPHPVDNLLCELVQAVETAERRETWRVH